MWADKFGIAVELTKHRGASICLEHYKTVRNFKAVDTYVVDRANCLVCRIHSLQGKMVEEVEKSSLMP
jgi:hypothetical protein